MNEISFCVFYVQRGLKVHKNKNFLALILNFVLFHC
jgi:hypothetical protein